MKINRDEIHQMMDLIDEEYLAEASQNYKTQSFVGMSRVILTVACIFIFLFAGMGVGGYQLLMKNSNMNSTESHFFDDDDEVIYKTDITNKTVWQTLKIMQESLEKKYTGTLYVTDLIVVLDTQNLEINWATFVLNHENTKVTASMGKEEFYYYEDELQDEERETIAQTDITLDQFVNEIFPKKTYFQKLKQSADETSASKQTQIRVNLVPNPELITANKRLHYITGEGTVKTFSEDELQMIQIYRTEEYEEIINSDYGLYIFLEETDNVTYYSAVTQEIMLRPIRLEDLK